MGSSQHWFIPGSLAVGVAHKSEDLPAKAIAFCTRGSFAQFYIHFAFLYRRVPFGPGGSKDHRAW